MITAIELKMKAIKYFSFENKYIEGNKRIPKKLGSKDVGIMVK
tara:strand:- start:349 stop:477 length:129 start_codon:yes stop_codon:yes gene_type:complete